MQPPEGRRGDRDFSKIVIGVQRFQSLNRLRKSQLLHRLDIGVNVQRRIFESLPHHLDRCAGSGHVQIKLAGQEIIGMPRLNTVRFQVLRGKIFEVAGDDHGSPTLDRRRQHMSVIEIGQL